MNMQFDHVKELAPWPACLRDAGHILTHARLFLVSRHTSASAIWGHAEVALHHSPRHAGDTSQNTWRSVAHQFWTLRDCLCILLCANLSCTNRLPSSCSALGGALLLQLLQARHALLRQLSVALRLLHACQHLFVQALSRLPASIETSTYWCDIDRAACLRDHLSRASQRLRHKQEALAVEHMNVKKISHTSALIERAICQSQSAKSSFMLKQVPGSLLGGQLLLQPFQLLAQLHVGAPQLLLAVPGCSRCACLALQVRLQLCYALSLLACLLLHTYKIQGQVHWKESII